MTLAALQKAAGPQLRRLLAMDDSLVVPAQARTELGRTQMFADSLQTKINSLKTDFVNRDNRVEREKIEQELNTALAELERLKKEVADKQKAITAIQDEGRKAGAPAAWLR